MRIPDASMLGDRTVPNPRPVSVQHRGADIAADSMAQTVASGRAALRQIQQQDDAFNYGRARSAMLAADVGARKQLEGDPDYLTHETRYSDMMKVARETAGKLISGPRSRALFEQEAQADILKGTEAIRGQAKVKEGQWGRAELDTMLESNRRAALETSDPALRAQLVSGAQDLIEGARRKGYIGPEDAVQVSQAWAKGYGEGSIAMLPPEEREAALADPNGPAKFIDPAKRATLLEAAKVDAAQAKVETAAQSILATYRQDSRAGSKALSALESQDMPAEQKDAIRAAVIRGQGLIHAERRQQFGEQVTDLERRINADDPGPKAEAEAAFLYSKGAYTADQYTNVLQQIDTARQKGAGDTAVTASVQDALVTGKRLDPKNDKIVKAVDSAFDQAMKINKVEPGSDEWVNSAAVLANKTNILPPSAMSWTRANLLSGEPKLVAPAAAAMARFAEAAPTAYAYFDDPNLKAYSEQVSALLAVGAKPESAVETARQNMSIPKARQQELQSTYTKEEYAADNAGELQSFMDKDDAFDVSSGWGGAPVPSLSMRDEYNAAVRTYFDKTNGNIEQARQLAWKDIRGVYGYSTVNGTPEILKHAPEIRFPGIDVGVIRSDVEAAGKARNITTPVRMVPSTATETTKGMVWQLHTTDEDGYEVVLLDDKNRPLQYAIPTDTSSYLAAQEKTKADAIASARKLGEQRRAVSENLGTAMSEAATLGY
jgi:hypothetical protein